MKRIFEKNFPPGYVYKPELVLVITAVFLCGLGSFISFCSVFSREREALYIRRGIDVILDGSRVMPDFVTILDDKLFVFLILTVLVLTAAPAVHYGYHYFGSKSIYLMRRLPNRFELYRRCLLIPVLAALTFLLTALVIFFVDYAIYMNLTPRPCLSPDQWQKIWRVFR